MKDLMTLMGFMVHLVQASVPVSMFIRDIHDQVYEVPESQTITTIADVEVTVYCSYDLTWSLCTWRYNQEDDCVFHNPSLSKDYNSCPSEVSNQGKNCQVRVARVSAKNEVDWYCTLNNQQPEGLGNAKRAMRIIRPVDPWIDADSTVFLEVGVIRTISCYVEAEEVILLEWWMNDVKLGNVNYDFNCNDNCVTNATVTFEMTEAANNQGLTCKSIRMDTFGRSANSERSIKVVIDENLPGSPPALSTIEIVFLSLGLALLIVLIIVILLCIRFKCCCFKDEEESPKLKQNQTFPFWTEQSGSKEVGVTTSDLPPPPIPPKSETLRSRVAQEQLQQFHAQSPTHIWAPKPRRAAPPAPPPTYVSLPRVPDEVLYGNEQMENAAQDELRSFNFGDNLSQRPPSRADDLSSLETASHLDELDLGPELKRLGKPFRPLSAIFGEESSSLSSSSSSSDADTGSVSTQFTVWI